MTRTVDRRAYATVVWTGEHFALAVLAAAGDGDGATMPRLYRYRAGQTTPSGPPLDLAGAAAGRSRTTMTMHGTALVLGWIDGTGTNAMLRGALVEAGAPRGIAAVGPVAVSADVRSGLLFSLGGNLFCVLRTVDSGGREGLSYAGLGADGNTLSGPVRFYDEPPREIEALVSEGSGLLAVGGGGSLLAFDGAGWSVAASVASILPGSAEPSLALRAGGGLWSVWSVDVEAGDPQAIYGAPIPLEEEPAAHAFEGWRGADPAIAKHRGGAMLATVQQDSSTAPRQLALGQLTAEGTATVSPPCRVPFEPGYAAANDPDIACGGGWCAVTWLEGVERFSADYIVRFAQVPAGDHSHLCR